MTKRPTDGIRRACGIVEGMRDNEFATVEVRKAAIAEACGRIDAEVDAMQGRLMPEVYEWPRFEDGEPVRIGDEVGARTGGSFVVGSVTLRDDSFALNASWYERGERVKRPAVLAADGEPLEVGQTVYNVEDGTEYEVCKMGLPRVTVEYWCEGIAAHSSIIPSLLTHRAPILAADGIPLREGETVWFKTSGREMRVDKIEHRPEGFWALELFADGSKRNSAPVDVLIHTKPESPDSWERVEEDAWDDDCEYFGRDMNDCKGCPASRQDIDDFYCDENEKARDLVRRCKALSEEESRNE